MIIGLKNTVILFAIMITALKMFGQGGYISNEEIDAFYKKNDFEFNEITKSRHLNHYELGKQFLEALKKDSLELYLNSLVPIDEFAEFAIEGEIDSTTLNQIRVFYEKAAKDFIRLQKAKGNSGIDFSWNDSELIGVYEFGCEYLSEKLPDYFKDLEICNLEIHFMVNEMKYAIILGMCIKIDGAYYSGFQNRLRKLITEENLNINDTLSIDENIILLQDSLIKCQRKAVWISSDTINIKYKVTGLENNDAHFSIRDQYNEGIIILQDDHCGIKSRMDTRNEIYFNYDENDSVIEISYFILTFSKPALLYSFIAYQPDNILTSIKNNCIILSTTSGHK